MISNPITGRSYISTKYPPNENEARIPDPGLTIATIIFCIVGPFWLIYKLAEHVTGKRFKFSRQIDQRTKKLA